MISKKYWILALCLAGLSTLMVGGLIAEEREDQKSTVEPARKIAPACGDVSLEWGNNEKARAGEQPSAGDTKNTEAMVKAGLPGTAHDALKPLIGTWSYELKMRMSPAGPWIEMSGEIERGMIFNGRFLHEDVSGPAMGGAESFQGYAVMGYDNVLKKYVGSWIDNKSTGIQTWSGDYDAAKKTFSLTGGRPDPVTGNIIKNRTTLTIKDDRTHTVQSFVPDKDGKDFLAFDMTCTKK